MRRTAHGRVLPPPDLGQARPGPVLLAAYPGSGLEGLESLLRRLLAAAFAQNAVAMPKDRPLIKISEDDRPGEKTQAELEGYKRRLRGRRVVLLSRHPRDIVLENARQSRGDDPGQILRHEVHGLDKVMAYLNIWAQNRYVPFRLLLVRHEDLIEDPAGELGRLAAFLGLEHVPQDILDRIATGMEKTLPASIGPGRLSEAEAAYVARAVAEGLDPWYGYGSDRPTDLKAAPTGEKPLFIHLGYYRSGSTFLQNVFGRTPGIQAVLQPGFFTSDRLYGLGPDHYRESVLARPVTGIRVIVDSDEAYSLGAFVDTDLWKLSAQALNYKASEHYLAFDIEEMADRILASAPEARILMNIRRQDSWFLSVYKHAVVNRALDADFETFLESGMGRVFLAAADYERVHTIYSERFGPERVHVLLFEDLAQDRAGYFQRLGEVLGVDIPPAVTQGVKKNYGVDNLTAYALRRINRLSETDPTRPERAEYLAEREALFGVRDTWKGRDFSQAASIMDEAAGESLMNRYREGNARLAGRLGLETAMRKYGYFGPPLDEGDPSR